MPALSKGGKGGKAEKAEKAGKAGKDTKRPHRLTRKKRRRMELMQQLDKDAKRAAREQGDGSDGGAPPRVACSLPLALRATRLMPASCACAAEAAPAPPTAQQMLSGQRAVARKAKREAQAKRTKGRLLGSEHAQSAALISRGARPPARAEASVIPAAGKPRARLAPSSTAPKPKHLPPTGFEADAGDAASARGKKGGATAAAGAGELEGGEGGRKKVMKGDGLDWARMPRLNKSTHHGFKSKQRCERLPAAQCSLTARRPLICFRAHVQLQAQVVKQRLRTRARVRPAMHRTV